MKLLLLINVIIVIVFAVIGASFQFEVDHLLNGNIVLWYTFRNKRHFMFLKKVN